MKKLLPDLRISKTTEGGFIVNTTEKYFSVSEDAALLLELMISNTDNNIIANTLSDRLNCKITFDDVVDAIRELPQEFFELKVNPKVFKFSFVLLKEKNLEYLARIFSVFFQRKVVGVMGLMIATALMYTNSLNSYNLKIPAYTPFLILLSIIFHEIGHAAACFSMGARPRLIGIGIKGIFPAFYTDVSDIWIRGKKERMIVDVGGIYFQLIFATFLSLFIPFFPEISIVVKSILILAFFSCLPYFRFDGYWLLGDWLGQENLNHWMKNKIKSIFSNPSFSNLKVIFGITIYFIGFILIHAWIFFSFWTILQAVNVSIFYETTLRDIANYISKNQLLESTGLKLAIELFIFLFIVFSCSKKSLSEIMKIIRPFHQTCRDIAITVAAIIFLGTINLLKYKIIKTEKNRKYVSEVENSIGKISPPISYIHKVAIKSLISKYQTITWYFILSKVNTKFGFWLISKTHKVASENKFSYINNIKGPVLLLAPHYGSFISAAMMLLANIDKSRPIHLFYADPKIDTNNAGYEDFYRRYFPNLSVLFNNKRGVISAAKALRRGEILVIMPDVFSGADLVKISFMGRTIGVMSGIGYFHRKFDAKLIPILSKFNSFFDIDIFIEKELLIAAEKNTNLIDDTFTMLQVFLHFEKWFREYPQDWHCWEQFISLSVPTPKSDT